MRAVPHVLFLSLTGALVYNIMQTPLAQAPAAMFTLNQVGPNTWAAIDNRIPTAPAGANAGFVIGDDGVVVIDTFASADAATQLLAEIGRLTTLPIRFVINTHYHGDHVGGNGAFLDAGAQVLAQRNVRRWIHPENLKFLGPDPPSRERALIEGLAPPTVVYDHAVNLYLGSREIQVRRFPGHTGGDSVVLIPDAETVFGGDLFWRNTLPNLVDASMEAWIETLDVLAQGQPGYTFVPGHGDVGNAQDVAAFRDYLVTLRELVADARAQGRSGDAVVETVMPTLTERYGEWEFFEFFANPNILDTAAELNGTKRTPQADPGR